MTLEIFHYPLRSYNQFENKIKNGGKALNDNKVLPKNVGNTWRKLYKKYKSGKLKKYYLKQVITEKNIRKDKNLIEDNRLKNYLNDIL